MLDEQLGNYVEVLLIVMEDVLDQLEDFLYIFQLELVFVDKSNDLKDGRLEDDFVTSFKGDFAGIELFEVRFKGSDE
jgi:hypothetical protein